HPADAAALEAARRHPHARVQQAALLLLDHPPRASGRLAPPQVIDRLGAADQGLRQTALKVLQGHPEWAEAALGTLRRWVQTPALGEEQQRALSSLVLAFQKHPAVQQLTAAALTDRSGKTPAELRVL